MNVIFSMTKATLNGQNSVKQKFHFPSTFQCYLENSASNSASFPAPLPSILLTIPPPTPPSLYFKFFKKFLDVTPVVTVSPTTKSNIINSKVVENKPGETPYVML